jgi:hypothetical protein
MSCNVSGGFGVAGASAILDQDCNAQIFHKVQDNDGADDIIVEAIGPHLRYSWLTACCNREYQILRVIIDAVVFHLHPFRVSQNS